MWLLVVTATLYVFRDDFCIFERKVFHFSFFKEAIFPEADFVYY